MKIYILFLTIVFSLKLFAQHNDTVFLKREALDTPYPFYHVVFIDTTTKYINTLTSFTFNNWDSTTYFDQLKRLPMLKNKKTSISNNFPKQWIALYKLNEKYYLYMPSDPGNHYKFKFTDSTTLEFSMEGPEPSKINKVSVLSPTQVLIETTNYRQGKKLQIQIVDTTKGMAVFTFSPTRNNRESNRLLMVDATKAHLFPTIVNYCLTDKQVEFKFDKVDFKSLLK